MGENAKKEKAREFFEITSLRGDPKGTLRKCVFVPGECLEPATSAHSISRAKILVPMAGIDNILYEFDPYASMDLSNEPKYMIDHKWFKITPREASTFPGLCNSHDKIFNKIDNKVPGPDDQEGLFLLAYRTLIHSYWMNLNLLNMSAMLGEDIENSQESNTIYLRDLRNTAANFVKEMYDYYINNNWDSFEHKYITFENHSPTIAASSLRNLSDSTQQFSVPFLINIFPVDGNIVCVFSYSRDYGALVRDHLSDLLEKSDIIKKRHITSIIMREFNVMLFSPGYYSALSDLQKDKIRQMFFFSQSVQLGINSIDDFPIVDWHLF